MPSEDYKNIKKINDTKGRIRAQRIAEKDVEVLPNGEVINVPFGESLAGLDIRDDYLELHIYDEANRLIQSVYEGLDFKIDGDGGTKRLILNPGNDLRNNGYRYGRYRVVYNVFKELVGSRIGGKVRIQEISSTRKEIRILPIREKPLLKKQDLTDPNVDADTLRDLGLEKIHQSDRDFYYQFDAFGEGRDFDVLEYDKGFVFSAPDRYRVLNITGGRFKKNFKGKELIVTAQNGDIIYRTKIKKVINAQKIFVTSVFKKNGVRAPLPKSKFTILVGVQENNIPKKDLKNLAIFGDNKNYVISNWETDFITFDKFPHSIVLRFYDSLPDDIQVKDKFWIVREQVNPIIESIQLLSELDESPTTKLRPPNFEKLDFVNTETSDNLSTSFETWDTLLSTGSFTQNQLVDKYLGTDIDINSVNLNIDYENYSNYIHFSSATERIKNFKYKLGLIEGYTETSQSLANLPTGSNYTSSVDGKTELYNIDLKIRNLKNGFDGFEKYMYYESSSVADGKYGKTWPKSNSSRPFHLIHTTGSDAIDWYSEQITSASAYDRANPDYLSNNMPLHIVEDEQNDQFILFLDMIGQQFDVLWSYIKGLTTVKSRKEKLDEGIPKDLVYAIGKSLGWNFSNGNTLETLWEYALGVNEDGSDRIASVSVPNNEQSLARNDITKQVWKRIINNLPYILKTKGTSRSIRALLSCYGMPSSFIDIKEYGGPEPDPNKPSFFRKDIFSYNLNLSGSNNAYISSSWENYLNSSQKPHSVQIRFTAHDLRDNQVLVQSVSQSAAFGEGNWALRLNEFTNSNIDDRNGRVEFILGPTSDTNLLFKVSSSIFPIADGEHYSVMLTRETSSAAGEPVDVDETATGVLERDITYKLYVGKYDSGKKDIQYKSITSTTLDGSTFASASNKYFTNNGELYFGGSGSYYGVPFSGSIQEFRAWNEVLDEDSFNDFVRAPKSVYGNTFRSSFDNLGLHYDFDDKKNHSEDPLIFDKKPNSATAITASAVGYNTRAFHYSSSVDEHQFLYPNIGSNRPANKTRVEDNELVHGNLNPKKSVEVSGFDTAPLDSPKLGVYFSPTNVIDQDIIATFGNTNFDDFVGSPIDLYKDTYGDLQTARGFYYKKYEEVNNFTEYIDLLKYYDLSMFEQIKKLLPARAQSTVGVLVEPTILERPKIKYKPIRTNKGKERFEKDIDVNQEITPSGEFLDEESVIDVDNQIQVVGETSHINANVEDMETDIVSEVSNLETAASESIINSFGEVKTHEGEISENTIKLNPPSIREVSGQQFGNLAEIGFNLVSSSIDSDTFIEFSGSLNNSVEFRVGDDSGDLTTPYVFPTASFNFIDQIDGGGLTGVNITGSNNSNHVFRFANSTLISTTLSSYPNAVQDDNGLDYTHPNGNFVHLVVSGSSRLESADNLVKSINDHLAGFITASNDKQTNVKVQLTGSTELFPPYDIPILAFGKTTSLVGMGGGKIRHDLLFWTSSDAHSHKTGSDLLSEALVNKVNNAFSSSNTFVTLNGVTGSADDTKFQYITASFLPQYKLTPSMSAGEETDTLLFEGSQSRLVPRIIFKTTVNRDYKKSNFSIKSSSIADFFEFSMLDGNSDRTITTFQKNQFDLVIPSIDGIILNTDLYDILGSQNRFEGIIDTVNSFKQDGEVIPLEGQVNSPFTPETILYHVSKSDDGNQIKDGNNLISGKVFIQIDKKQSRHYNIGVKKFFVDASHPSGSGVKFGSAFLFHERTKGADTNLPSETSLRIPFFEGVKLKSDGPVNINLNPNEVNSNDTIDKGPVVEVNIVSPNTVLVSEPGTENNLYVDQDGSIY